MNIYKKLNNDLKEIVNDKIECDQNRCYQVKFSSKDVEIHIFLWNLWCDADPHEELKEIYNLRKTFGKTKIFLYCDYDYRGYISPICDYIFEILVHEWLALKSNEFAMVYEF